MYHNQVLHGLRNGCLVYMLNEKERVLRGGLPWHRCWIRGGRRQTYRLFVGHPSLWRFRWCGGTGQTQCDQHRNWLPELHSFSPWREGNGMETLGYFPTPNHPSSYSRLLFKYKNKEEKTYSQPERSKLHPNKVPFPTKIYLY